MWFLRKKVEYATNIQLSLLQKQTMKRKTISRKSIIRKDYTGVRSTIYFIDNV